MSVAPIPFTSISEFATIYDIDDFDDFLYLMRKLDNVYLEHHGKEERKHGR